MGHAFSKALDRAPDGMRPAIRLEMLDCLLSLGRIEEAREHINRFIATTPHHARYLCLLSSIGKHDASSEIFARVERELSRTDLDPVDRSDLMVRRGVMLQESRRHDEAFASFTEGKKLLRAPSVTAAFRQEVDARIAADVERALAIRSVAHNRGQIVGVDVARLEVTDIVPHGAGRGHRLQEAAAANLRALPQMLGVLGGFTPIFFQLAIGPLAGGIAGHQTVGAHSHRVTIRALRRRTSLPPVATAATSCHQLPPAADAARRGRP